MFMVIVISSLIVVLVLSFVC